MLSNVSRVGGIPISLVFIEARLDHPLLRTALRRVPAMRLEWVRNMELDGEREMLFWAGGGGAFDRFEAGLDEDPTVTLFRSVPLGEQRLYQVTMTPEGVTDDVYPVVVEVGGMVSEATVTRRGWDVRFVFPDAAGAERFFAAAREHADVFDLKRLYEALPADEEHALDLTQAQREALLVALEAGYFEVPRRCSLRDLSEELGVSDNAVSQRLRRGLKSLLYRTVGSELGGGRGR